MKPRNMIEGKHHLKYWVLTRSEFRKHPFVEIQPAFVHLIAQIFRKLFVLALIWAPIPAFCQSEFVNKGADVYIQQAGLLNVQGNFINQTGDSSGSINNDGIIELTGNFENQTGSLFQTYNNSQSKDRAVKFIGYGTQLIKGNMNQPGTSSFYNLVIDKSNAGSKVEMRDSMVIEGSLIFGTASINSTYEPSGLYTNNNQKGLLKTYNDTLGEFLLKINNGRPDAIAGYPILEMGGAPTTGYIVTSGRRGTPYGGLQRRITTATSYVFPVGTGDKGFNGVRLNFVQVPGTGYVKTKFCSGSTNPDGYIGKISQHCNGCTAINPAPVYNGYNKYFNNNDCNGGMPQWLVIEKTPKNHGYWSFASTDTGYYYDLEVFPNSLDVVDMSAMWRAIKHESEYGADPSEPNVDWRPEIETSVTNPNDLLTYTKNAGCNTSLGVPGGVYKDFSHFALGKGASGAALPVELLYFRAESMGKHRVHLTWATAIEIDNHGFEIQRSTDAVNFNNIGWVDGHNNSTSTQNYSFDDRAAQENRYYYRLKQMDNDGDFVYSNIVDVKLSGEEVSNFKLYPNPTTSDLVLEVNNPAEEIKVAIYDINGKVVYDNIYTVEQIGTTQTLTINASNFMPPGTYVLSAQTNGSSFSSKFVLQ